MRLITFSHSGLLNEHSSFLAFLTRCIAKWLDNVKIVVCQSCYQGEVWWDVPNKSLLFGNVVYWSLWVARCVLAWIITDHHHSIFLTPLICPTLPVLSTQIGPAETARLHWTTWFFAGECPLEVVGARTHGHLLVVDMNGSWNLLLTFLGLLLSAWETRLAFSGLQKCTCWVFWLLRRQVKLSCGVLGYFRVL